MATAKKRKKFFDVEIPLLEKQTQLLAYKPEELDGRIIKYDLTRFLKGKGTILQLDVKAEKDKLTSTPKKMQVLPYFLKKIVRKGTSYVEDSFSAKCKDAQIRIKPLLVTRRKVSRAVRKTLREAARKELTEYVKNKEVETIFEETIKNKIQKPLSLKLKKIYPLNFCDIRFLKVESKNGK